MKGRIAFFRSLLGFFTGLDSYAAVLAPQRSTIYNSGPRAGYVPGDLILKLKPDVTLHVLLATSPFAFNK